MKHVDIAEKLVDERCGRILIDFVRRADLLDMPLVQHDDTVCRLQSFFLVMRHQDARNVQFVMQSPKPASQLLSDFGIQCAKGFIKQEQFRFHGQRSGQGHALTLPSGKLVRIAVGHRPHLDQ